MSHESELIAALDDRDNWEAEAENYRSLYNRKCTWVEEDGGLSEYWETQCGNAFVLNDGTPAENDMQFCPYCGGHLVVPNSELTRLDAAGGQSGVAQRSES